MSRRSLPTFLNLCRFERSRARYHAAGRCRTAPLAGLGTRGEWLWNSVRLQAQHESLPACSSLIEFETQQAESFLQIELRGFQFAQILLDPLGVRSDEVAEE